MIDSWLFGLYKRGNFYGVFFFFIYLALLLFFMAQTKQFNGCLYFVSLGGGLGLNFDDGGFDGDARMAH